MCCKTGQRESCGRARIAAVGASMARARIAEQGGDVAWHARVCLREVTWMADALLDARHRSPSAGAPAGTTVLRRVGMCVSPRGRAAIGVAREISRTARDTGGLCAGRDGRQREDADVRSSDVPDDRVPCGLCAGRGVISVDGRDSCVPGALCVWTAVRPDDEREQRPDPRVGVAAFAPPPAGRAVGGRVGGRARWTGGRLSEMLSGR